MMERRASTGDLWLKRILALSAVWGFMIASALVLLGLATGSIKDPVVGIVCGSVVATMASEYKGVMAYIFGSSASSDAKSATISRALGTSDPPTTTTKTTGPIVAADGSPLIPATVTTTTAPAAEEKKS